MDRREMLKRSAGVAGAAGLFALPGTLRALQGPGVSTDRPHLEVAERAAAWIRSTRIETERGVTWAWNPTEAPGEATGSLYTGAPGVVLFLLELHHASGDPEHLAEARRGADEIGASLPAEAGAMGAGLYTGLAGWAFVLQEVHRATGERRYGDAALRAEALIRDGARPVGRGVEWDGTTDIVSGSAGTGLWLLRAHARDRSSGTGGAGGAALLELAVRVGHRLVELGEPAEGGLRWFMRHDVENRYPNFSHGTGGVAYFLATLHGVTGEEAFLDAALAGSDYLTAVADRHDGGCRVFHHEPGGEELYYLSWCHGAPGTARLFRRLEKVTGDVRWREEIACYARGVMETGAPERRGPGYWNNVSQCCGDAGVGEFFLALAGVDPRPGYRAMVDRVATRLRAEAVEDEGSGGLAWPQAEHRTRPGWVVPQTGFMQGAAGIGTYFLHLDGVAEGRAPRVLWPDSPWEERG